MTSFSDDENACQVIHPRIRSFLYYLVEYFSPFSSFCHPMRGLRQVFVLKR